MYHVDTMTTPASVAVPMPMANLTFLTSCAVGSRWSGGSSGAITPFGTPFTPPTMGRSTTSPAAWRKTRAARMGRVGVGR